MKPFTLWIQPIEQDIASSAYYTYGLQWMNVIWFSPVLFNIGFGLLFVYRPKKNGENYFFACKIERRNS